jgi:hypothetical protein
MKARHRAVDIEIGLPNLLTNQKLAFSSDAVGGKGGEHSYQQPEESRQQPTVIICWEGRFTLCSPRKISVDPPTAHLSPF